MPRLFALTTSGGSKRKLASSIAFFVGTILAACGVGQIILANDSSVFALFGFGVVGVVFAIKILNNWRQGLYIFFGWLFVEDFARKHLGNNPAIFFAKDVLVVLVYLSFYVEGRNRKEKATFRPPFLIPLLIFFWLAAGQVFNFASTSVLFGFLGLKLYFLYIPLMYLGYALMDSELDLRRFFMFNAMLIFAVASLGIAQSIIGPTFLNPAVLQEDIREMNNLYRVSPITGLAAYRPSSVFVSSGRFQDFLIASWIIILGFQYVARVLHAPPTGIGVENGYGQLVIEMGVVGLLLWLVLGASLALSAWKIVKQLRGSPWFPIAFVIFWFIFLIFFPLGYTSLSFYQDFLMNAYLWILIGILYRLPSIALSAQFVAEGSEVPSRGAPQQATVPSVVATNQGV